MRKIIHQLCVIMDIIVLCVILLSIVLESFPISSSGHIELFKKIATYFGYSIGATHDLDLLLHGPTALVVAIFFYQAYKPLLWPGKRSFAVVQKIFFLGCITDSLTVAIYVLMFDSLVQIPLWIGFLITFLLLFSLIVCPNKKPYVLWNCKNALVLGVVQACALIPGISRFGSTFVAARWCGISAQKAFQLSFLLEWPISCAAFLKGAVALYKKHLLFELLQLKVIVIMLIAMVGAFVGLKIMRAMIVHDTVWLFSLYVVMVTFFALL